MTERFRPRLREELRLLARRVLPPRYQDRFACMIRLLIIGPSVSTSMVFCSTIGRYIDGYAERSGLSVSVRSSPQVDKLPRRMQRTLFRIVQEGLANVHRHACASHASFQLRWISGRVHVIITDDGRGVRDKQHGSPMRMGVGLRGIRAPIWRRSQDPIWTSGNQDFMSL